MIVKASSMLERIKRKVRGYSANDKQVIAETTVSEYWSLHNVTSHHDFTSVEDSLEYFCWRCDQYYPYLALMPVKGHDGKAILDYGCGPGHDLVGFGVYSRPARLIGMDVAAPSLSEARARLALHKLDAELIQIRPGDAALKLEDESVDYIHCSGVLHHVGNPLAVMKEFYRLLKPGGEVRVMVYNRDSIWVNLYVAYQKMILEDKYAGVSLAKAFSYTTDGEGCPISRFYTSSKFLQLGEQAGFCGKYLGAAISMHEASVYQESRYKAIQDRRLPAECREWLLALRIDEKGFPVYQDTYAGIDACFALAKP